MSSQLLFGSLLLCAVGIADDKPPVSPLPAAWHGAWSGKLIITSANDATSEVLLVFKIEPIKGTRELTWVMTFGEGDKTVVKDYKLVPVGDKPGRFGLDERNGVVLDARLVKGVLYSQFETGGSLLVARYELAGDTLRYELTAAKPTEKTAKGQIQGYGVNIVQAAELKRK